MFALLSLRRLWWVVAVVVIACQSPNRAEAGCSGHSGSQYPLIESESQPATDHPAAPLPAKPCQGPNCSGAPLRDGLPVPPAAPAPTVVKDQVARFNTHDSSEPPARFEREDPSAKPVRHADPIFHPPRHG